jgi:hypothetical protein
MPQSYVGKPPISKGIGSIIQRFVVSPFNVGCSRASAACIGAIRLTVAGRRRQPPRVARLVVCLQCSAAMEPKNGEHSLRQMVRGRIHGPRGGRNELPILFQSALIPVARDPGRAAMMMRNQTTKLQSAGAQHFLGSVALALTADPVVLLARCRSRLDRVAGRSIEALGVDFQLAAMLGLIRRFEFSGPPACGRRREATQRQSAVSPP